MPPPPAADLSQAVAASASVEGWLTAAQAERLAAAACRVRAGGRIVEIGSFRGRSTVVLALAAADGVEVVAIDPHAGTDRGPNEISGYEAEAQVDHQAFLANLQRAGVGERVRHVRRFSRDAHGEVAGAIDVLFVDGAHRLGPARADLVEWGDRVAEGGTLLVHDAYSSVGVTLALASTMFLGRRFRYIGRDGSLVELRREVVGGRARLANVGRQLLGLPWFARNVVVKVLLVLRLRPLTRLLGHRDGTWPY